MNRQELFERIASHLHKSWHLWIECQVAKGIKNGDGAIIIPKEQVERWTRDASVQYSDLPEDDKQAYREEARKMLHIITDFIDEFEAEVLAEAVELKESTPIFPEQIL